jgi:hypothetical protein
VTNLFVFKKRLKPLLHSDLSPPEQRVSISVVTLPSTLLLINRTVRAESSNLTSFAITMPAAALRTSALWAMTAPVNPLTAAFSAWTYPMKDLSAMTSDALTSPIAARSAWT